MKKAHTILKHIYGIIIIVSFFAGLLPLIPYIAAIIIGGSTGEAISLFVFNEYYPWVIASASIGVIIGMFCTYLDEIIKKQETKNNKKDENDSAEENA